jgi:biopolymer transport protein TolR
MDAPNRRNNREPISAINVTPLVDVMLVLLIIFMVTASMGQQGITVNLPKAKADAVKVSDEMTVVSIDKDQQVFINDTKVDRGQLTQMLRDRFAKKTQKAVYLKSDKVVPYGDFVSVVGLIKEAGVEQLGMITEPPKQ